MTVMVTRVNAYRKRYMFTAIGAALGLALAFMPAAGAITIGGPSDCDDNAIIKCGTHSTGALASAYNSSAYVRQVFAQFGISAADMADMAKTNVAGSVTKDGKVFVEGRSDPVATGAVTAGRQPMPGSTKVNARGAVFYKRPPSVSFQQDSLPAFVSMKNNRFQFAVIASCGNPVRATPTAPQKKPRQQAAVGQARVVSKAQPRQKSQPSPPEQTQVQSQSQQVTQQAVQDQEVTINNTTTQTPPPAAPAEDTVAAAAPEQETAAVPEAGGKGALPNVGPGSAGSLGAAFAVSTVLGTFGYRRYLAHILGN